MTAGSSQTAEPLDPGGRPGLSRRRLLRGAAAGVVAVAAGALVEACSTSRGTLPPASTSPVSTVFPPPASGGTVTLGSNASDPAPKAALQAVIDAFTQATGIDVTVNTVDHASFQNTIGTYLQGRPDDVFTWFAGDRMRFFADEGLVRDLTGAWSTLGQRYGGGVRAASTGRDGKPYFVPFYDYPWAIVYRRSLWDRQGYAVPSTWDELLALASRMRSDGLVPFAFADKDGWPAMGFFDILDLRLNGYAFHIDLLAGRASWTDARVVAVFERWRELLPHLQAAALGRTWQEAAQGLMNEQTGMYYIGTFAGEQATDAQRADLELAPFPMLGTAFDAERAIDAPINGFMSAPHPSDPAAADTLLAFLGSPRAQELFVSQNPNYVAVAPDADTSGYTAFQRKMASILAGAGQVAQFFDRDTRPDFAGTTGMQSFFQDFVSDPEGDLGALLGRIQAFWNSLSPA